MSTLPHVLKFIGVCVVFIFNAIRSLITKEKAPGFKELQNEPDINKKYTAIGLLILIITGFIIDKTYNR